MTQVRQKHTN